MKRAVITGVLGQDGAYLTRLLLNKGYRVYGTHRRTSSFNAWRLDELGIRNHPNLTLSVSDITDPGSCLRILELAQPQEVYNLAAQSFVGTSFDQPTVTAQIDGIGALNLLEAIRTIDRSIRFYQASSAEMFGLVQTIPQSETTQFYPRSPYAVAKLYAHWMAINYRESHNIFASCGIMFNHESPMRGIEFVTRKITDAVARLACGESIVLELGNLDAIRDWGYAEEYVEGMWRTLQTNASDTYVFATGCSESVREFATMAFASAGIEIDWHGKGEEECAVAVASNQIVARVSPEFYRPAEVESLIGDFSKAERELGWRPQMSLRELCKLMVDTDIRRQQLSRSTNGSVNNGWLDRDVPHLPARPTTNRHRLNGLPSNGAGAVFHREFRGEETPL
ncbi:GDP-mannose 4,6-dehydratase [Acidisphaera sp. S103]|uniref:GDP-mannose 4,6-dehydratase n=1 Tax=Acidisphaera sp. S103 TaxID=1747223 RepID=UPI00131DB81E